VSGPTLRTSPPLLSKHRPRAARPGVTGWTPPPLVVWRLSPASVQAIRNPFRHCRRVELPTAAYLTTSPPPLSNQIVVRRPPSASGEHLPRPYAVSHADSNLSPPRVNSLTVGILIDLPAPVTLTPLSLFFKKPRCVASLTSLFSSAGDHHSASVAGGCHRFGPPLSHHRHRTGLVSPHP
jgi:hypothetical protein